MSEEQGYINFITAEILDDERLEDSAKLLYVRITGLSKKTGCCYASDAYLAEKLNKNERTIQRYLKDLAELGYIQRVINYFPDSKKIKSRYICINRPLFSGDKFVDNDTDVGISIDMDVDISTDTDVGENNKNMNNISFTEVNDIICDQNKKMKKFVIPSVEEIERYCLERKNNVNAQNFHDFYTSKGWMVGKTKMKDWKASIRTWERNDKSFSQQKNQKNNGVCKKSLKTTEYYRSLSS